MSDRMGLNDHVQRSHRLSMIVRAINSSRSLSVEALSQLTGVSEVTVRRDLVELVRSGQVRRTHGGAEALPQRGVAGAPFRQRYEAAREVNERLGAAVASLLRDGDSVVLDSGTTCFTLATLLAGRDLTVIPLSLHAAAVLAERPLPRVVLPGGPVEPDSQAMNGAGSVQMLQSLSADVVVLGPCAASAAHGLTATTSQEAVLKAAATQAAASRIVVAPASKLLSTATFRFARLDQVDHLVTTRDAPGTLLHEFAAEGAQLHLV